MDFRPSIPGIPHKYAYDDATTAYQVNNLFDSQSIRGNNLGQGLLGGCPPETSALVPAPIPADSLAKRAWKVLTFPIVWLVRKIVEVFKKIFPCLFKSESAAAERDKAPKFCQKTVDELIAGLTSETDSLKKCVEALNLGELDRFKKLMDLEARMQILRDLHAMHFEIVEAFRTIGETLSKDRAQTISKKQKEELGLIQFNLNSAYNILKDKLRGKSEEIVQLFHEIKESMTPKKMEKSDLWTLRSYLSILKFFSDHIEELYCNRTHAPYLDLAVEPSQEYLAISGIEKIDSLKEQVQKVINKKVQELLGAQEEQKKALGAESVFLPNGIENVGNSCYMNSTLQALFGSPLIEKLRKVFSDGLGYSEDERRIMQAVREALNSFKSIYDIENKELRKQLMKDVAFELRTTIFSSNLVPDFLLEEICGQQDAAALMEGLLKVIGFRFDLQKTISSLEGDNDKTVKTESSHMLQVPISNEGMSFQQAVNGFEIENIDDSENKWSIRDESDRELRAHSRYRNEYQITRKIPDVMVVQLKRFTFNKTLKRASKIDTPITWDSDVVDLSKLIDPSLVRDGESTKYRIVSYVKHVGGVGGGHYTANVRRGDHFYKCNDNSPVVQVSDAREKQDREHAYLFVLERVDV